MADQPSRGGRIGTSLTSTQIALPYNLTVRYGIPQGTVQGPNGDLVQPTHGNTDSAGWFSPLNPIGPIAPAEIAGRSWDFPSGYNLAVTERPYEPISFNTLRALAYTHDVLRVVLETRKDELSALDWQITPRDQKAAMKAANGAGKPDPGVKAVTDFFQMPDGFHNWDDWLRRLLEDLFVIDAPSLYINRTRAGQMAGLYQVDGATIKPVIDDWGNRPLPYVDPVSGETVYPIAYQQILKGYPAVDYSVRDLIYRPRNLRINHAYGFSPVEQIVNTVNTALRRELFTLNYFTEGTVPDAMIKLPETWTPQQIATYQAYWDSYFEGGDMARRRKIKFVPGSTGNALVQSKEPDLKSDFDEWLVRIICASFSVSPTPFVKQVNRATAETSQTTAEDQGLQPGKKWIKALIDFIITTEFNRPDLEFAWKADTSTDEATQSVTDKNDLSSAIFTINEIRDRRGALPFNDPAADKLMALTMNGYVPIDANTIEGKQANVEAFGTPDGKTPPAPPNDGNNDDSASVNSPANNGKNGNNNNASGKAGNGKTASSASSKTPAKTPSKAPAKKLVDMLAEINALAKREKGSAAETAGTFQGSRCNHSR